MVKQHGWEKLMEILSENNGLTHLCLEDCALTDDNLTTIFQSLLGLSSTIA